MLAPLLILALTSAAPLGKPEPEPEHGFTGGTYLSVSGGGNLSVAPGQPHRLGAGLRTCGGHLFAFRGPLKIYAGGGFEHRALHLGAPRGESRQTSGFAMVRVGGGSARLWGYGLLAPGLGLRVDPPEFEGAFNEGQVLVTLEAGAGAALAVWRGLFVGAEATFDIGSGYAEGDIFLNLRLGAGWTF